MKDVIITILVLVLVYLLFMKEDKKPGKDKNCLRVPDKDGVYFRNIDWKNQSLEYIAKLNGNIVKGNYNSKTSQGQSKDAGGFLFSFGKIQGQNKAGFQVMNKNTKEKQEKIIDFDNKEIDLKK